MTPDWKDKLLKAAARDSSEQEEIFLSLVDQAAGNVDFETAKVLMKTYSAKPDFETQERVESVLATGNPAIVTKAVLEEMPRLVLEAPEWAETLLGQELEHRPSLVISAMSNLSPEAIEAIQKVSTKPEFIAFYENAKLLTR